MKHPYDLQSWLELLQRQEVFEICPEHVFFECGKPGWTFLEHPQNLEQLGHGRTWLLDRVASISDFQTEFFESDGVDGGTLTGTPKWQSGTVEKYLQNVERFLDRLLLLTHLTSGQPARGSELLSIGTTGLAHTGECFLKTALSVL